ncbi:hypothetical protein JCM19000A_05970 [Silvimonas sp. JCM 19000]
MGKAATALYDFDFAFDSAFKTARWTRHPTAGNGVSKLITFSEFACRNPAM